MGRRVRARHATPAAKSQRDREFAWKNSRYGGAGQRAEFSPAFISESILKKLLHIAAAMKNSDKDYSLDKSKASWSNFFMDSNPHFFFGLAADADALIVLRMSFLMLASNFRMGTRLNSFFRPSSNGSLL